MALASCHGSVTRPIMADGCSRPRSPPSAIGSPAPARARCRPLSSPSPSVPAWRSVQTAPMSSGGACRWRWPCRCCCRSASTTPTTTAMACAAPTTLRVGPMRLVATGTASPSAVKRAALLCSGLRPSSAWRWRWRRAGGCSWSVPLQSSLPGGTPVGPGPYGYLGLGRTLRVHVFRTRCDQRHDVRGDRATSSGRLAGGVWGRVRWRVRCWSSTTFVTSRPIRWPASERWRCGSAIVHPRLYAVLVIGALILAVVCAFDRAWALLALAGDSSP